jgi:adenine-specific DNA-methyltransferase
MAVEATRKRFDPATRSAPDVFGTAPRPAVARSLRELATSRAAARHWIAAVGGEDRRRTAAALSALALQRFAELAVPWSRLSDPPLRRQVPLDAWAGRLADRIAAAAADLPFPEGAHQVASLYTILLPERLRSSSGAFYTPPALANRLAELAEEAAIDWSSAHVLDPAAGGGALILAAALKMRGSLDCSDRAGALASIGARLRGFEADPHAAWLAQGVLELALGDLACAGRVPEMVTARDTIETPPCPRFDLVIGNPPYGRVALSAQQRQRFARSLYGHANLYGVFTDLAIQWAKPGGLVALLTPTSMLGGQYYSALRRLLAQEAPPLALDFVQARRGVFEDVLQETLLALYRRGGERQRIRVHYLQVSSEDSADIVSNGTIALPTNPLAPWLAPREPQQSGLIGFAEDMPGRLADLGYEVCTGPLVWNRMKDRLRHAPGPNILPLIWAEAVGRGGEFAHRAEKRGHAPYFELGSGDKWLRVTQGCVLVQRTTAKEQPRRLVAAEMPNAFVRRHGGVVVENHLNMVRPSGEPKVGPAVVAALLNSRIVDQLFRCISGSVAVSAFELSALPLPDADELRELSRLVASRAGRDAVEAECRRLYGQPLE